MPPLHPRCRCVIIYKEVGIARVKPPIDESIVRSKLETAKAELKIKGELIYPPPKMYLSDFAFDAAHTQGDKHPHNVTEQDARKFIAEAYFAILKYNGNSVNYYGKNGAAFVRKDLQTIRTAFKAIEYDEKVKKMIEVYENEFG